MPWQNLQTAPAPPGGYRYLAFYIPIHALLRWLKSNLLREGVFNEDDLTPLLTKGKNALGLLAGHVMLTSGSKFAPNEQAPQFVGLLMVSLEGDDKPLFFNTAM